MKVREIAKLIPDQIILYKKISDNMEFANLYKGEASGIPGSVADMEVKNIGAARKGIVDICVN